MQSTEKIRTVIIGAGMALDLHMPGLKLPATQVVGIADTRPEIGLRRAQELGTVYFRARRSMLAEMRPDLVVILTPHPSHASLAIECMQAGCHVLVEKPMAVEVREADQMIAVAQDTGRLLAVNFQHRLRPEVQAARAILHSGRLGTLQRMSFATCWPRTAAYYRSSAWRGTWMHEGGGVLLNQAPHDLDLICYLLGLPAQVYGRTRTQVHSIEVEDTADAMLEWENGMVGYFHTSTVECNPRGDLEIYGTGGVLRVGDGRLSLDAYEVDAGEYLRSTDEFWHGPGLRPAAVDLPDSTGDHAAIYRNLHQAILNSAPLAADGFAGRKSLELANAIILSNRRGATVSLPVDREAYHQLLAELRSDSYDQPTF